MQDVLTELLVDFSDIVHKVFDLKKEIQEQLPLAYKDKLRIYEFSM